MTGFFDIKSTNFLGGTNVQNIAILVGIGFLAYRSIKYK
jgi:hypothetical protein